MSKREKFLIILQKKYQNRLRLKLILINIKKILKLMMKLSKKKIYIIQLKKKILNKFKKLLENINKM